MKILVTGGTGTFGRAFARACVSRYRDQVERVRLMGSTERSVAAATHEFRDYHAVSVITANVRDADRMRQAVWGVDVVVHAAAMKRIGIINYQPEEAVKTNVLGTLNVINAAIQARVPRVVVVSSDKAVAPANAYGVTKAMAEHFAVQHNSIAYPQGTSICAVRYGNILASSDSVLQVWQRQIDAGKPLTIHNPMHTRFVMMIDEAVDLVWTAQQHCVGGEIWIPFLEACSVRTLKSAFAPDSPEVYLGAQRGEKAHEALLSDEEPNHTNTTDRHYIVLPQEADWAADSAWPGRPVTLPLTYRSDTARQLTVPEVREKLKAQGLLGAI